jgi:DNA helicase-2/ATP-dependent DNA helicase PcrA
MSIPSRFLEEVPLRLIENLGSRPPVQSLAWSTPGYPKASGRSPVHTGDFADRHYNYEDENQEAPRSIDNIARFFGGKAGPGKPGSLPRPAVRVPHVPTLGPGSPAMDIPASSGALNLKKGQHVRHAKYGEGAILLREGDGESAKLTILFNNHGVKKLMEKFANLKKI